MDFVILTSCPISGVHYNLLDRVFRYTRNVGDQEEKYKSLYLKLSWSKEDLTNLLNRRVNQLVKEQYTNREVHVRELLPGRVDKKNDALDYILDRTLLAPRDVIIFFNECIKMAEGKATISRSELVKAEALYSEGRLRALADEWSADYPDLIPVVFCLKKLRTPFTIDSVDKEKFREFMLNFLVRKETNKSGFLYYLINEKLWNESDHLNLLRELVKVFYRVGILGVKTESFHSTYWSFHGQRVTLDEIDESTSIEVHPAFWRELGIDATPIS